MGSLETTKKVLASLSKFLFVGEDELKDGQDAIQKLTDAKIKEIDSVVSAKEKDVMTV